MFWLCVCVFFTDSQGSVLANVELTFQDPVFESEIGELTRKVTKDGKLGQLEVSEVSVGSSEPGQLLFSVFYVGGFIGVFVKTDCALVLPFER